MTQKKMVVLHCFEGHVDISRMTKEEILAKLAKAASWEEDDDGNSWHGMECAPAGTVPDLEHWNGIIVIDGDIVAPKPVKVVTEYEL